MARTNFFSTYPAWDLAFTVLRRIQGLEERLPHAIPFLPSSRVAMLHFALPTLHLVARFGVKGSDVRVGADLKRFLPDSSLEVHVVDFGGFQVTPDEAVGALLDHFRALTSTCVQPENTVAR